ncbi:MULTISPECIES: MFS transporter [Pseudomonas]|uniref:Sugar porter family MFS transporter n=1 Tax=Pseudomonas lactis TaxID=1615674 RepID=A0A921T947_9PSED|nr:MULTISPECIES: MFS transporter [Pseudomonas]HJH20323.1 sugar porter family MFS transporter [Pseudomonas lactis]
MINKVLFDDVPLRPFHTQLAFCGTGGQISDGFVLGIISIAVAMAAGPLQLDALWLGLLGAASLAGLFFGSLLAGPFADRYGRRPLFAYNMLVFATLSAAQFFVDAAWQLFVLRLLLGFVLGTDYVVSKALISEYSPRHYRGRLLSILAVAWAAGYVGAYVVGYCMRDMGPDAWRYMLAVSCLPALIIFPFRLSIPESPLWLVKRGRVTEAREIVKRLFGDAVVMPSSPSQPSDKGTIRRLFSPRWRRNTLVACVFYICQVIPLYALGTFAPKVLEALQVRDGILGGLVFNLLIFLGAIVGLVTIDKLSRRTFLLVTFYLGALALGVLALGALGPLAMMITFGLFGCIMSAAANLEFVYPAELFPTDLRASGVGLAVAFSRLGSAISTFLLPLTVQHFGIRFTLIVCIAVLLFGGLFCHLFAPETRGDSLSGLEEAEKS